MHRTLTICVAVLLGLTAGTVTAAYPDKPIRVLVQYGPGASTDAVARLVAGKLTEALGQQVIVDNKPGANGILATDTVAKSVPDGYTLLLNTNADAANVSMYKSLPYDLEKDFVPISRIGEIPHIVVVHPSVPANTLKELVALAKQKPGTLNFASVGAGSTPHLAGELFKTMTNTDMVHVPYKSSGQSISELLGGQIQVMFLGAVAALPQVKSGKLRALAVTSKKRLPELPDTPTVAEALGLPDYEASTWWGLLGPAGTPETIVVTINKAVASVLTAPETIEAFRKLGAVPIKSTPTEFGAFQKEEVAKWGKVIRDTGVQPQ